MEDLNDLLFFAKVIEHRGFSAASRQLGVPKSRLSRRISQLEQRLGVRLLQRSSRRLVLTSVGELFYERCQQMVALGESAHELIDEAVSQPQGLLRVSCPISLAQFWLTPLLPEFMKACPGVRLVLTVSNRRVDPLEEPMDVVIRVRRPPFDDSSLVVRPLGRTQDVLMASPALLRERGTPADLQSLGAWPTLSLPAEGERYAWRLAKGNQADELLHAPRMVCGDMLALRHAAIEGLGVVLLPQILCRDELADGRLVRLLPDWSCTDSEVQAVFPTRRGMLPAVRALVDFLARHGPT
ncbi:LysR substrate-binding domain-containing protein [Variovorax sp. KK3]|uniref:LysR substrate-binding domain-containing protein n=1 Tax=Variovorax sp. KK3 TaxID=1855728 RepID=UPI00097BC80A|nr:LysR substrate-binding domain-containing protein [Variovorax sp. KK3]